MPYTVYPPFALPFLPPPRKVHGTVEQIALCCDQQVAMLCLVVSVFHVCRLCIAIHVVMLSI